MRQTSALFNDADALFGHDPTASLVAAHPVALEQQAAAATMRVYRRCPATHTVLAEDVPWYPFFFLKDMRLLQGFPRQRFWCKTLEGENAYRYLIVFATTADYWEALRHLSQKLGKNAQRSAEVYAIAQPVQQYLMQSGRTLFKGMHFDDLYRLQLDLEVWSSGTFPQAQRPEDRIILIALADNRGWQQVLDGRELDEPAMLEALVHILRERDPDVIEGHNIYAFDLAYLLARCALYGIPFAIGRDGSVPRTFASSMRFAERTVAFPAVDIAGRHVIDTYLQVLAFDVFKRDLPGYGLKAAARYFGLASAERTYVEGRDIARTWQTHPEQLLAYALDDVGETERLARHLSGSTFYLTQMLPMAYGHVARTGPASKIEALMVREYLRSRHALPQRGSGHQVHGGYTDVFVSGVVGPIVYADVESLYPSIMLRYDVCPRGDTLKLFPHLLQRLTTLRLETKERMRLAPTPEARSALDAQQSSYKILINSFYGQLGFQQALFNDFAEADRVTTTGQELLRQLLAAIWQAGGKVVEVDTDGVFFVPPPEVHTEADERAFVQQLSTTMPAGIRLGYEGRFRKMLSYKIKNYALLTYDGRVQCKGSSLVSRSIEPFGRAFVLEAITLLLREDVAALHELYITTARRIQTHAWDVEDFARTETLKDSVAHYQAAVAGGKRPHSAAYELAIARRQRTGQPVHQGDRITYYITGSSPTVASFEHCRLAEEWNPAQPDENTAYYLRRLGEFTRKCAVFFRGDDFQRIFSDAGLFRFDPQGIALQTLWKPAQQR